MNANSSTTRANLTGITTKVIPGHVVGVMIPAPVPRDADPQALADEVYAGSQAPWMNPERHDRDYNAARRCVRRRD